MEAIGRMLLAVIGNDTSSSERAKGVGCLFIIGLAIVLLTVGIAVFGMILDTLAGGVAMPEMDDD